MRSAPGIRDDLPIAVTIGQDLPARLSLKPQLPSLRGSPHSSFDYQFAVKNEGDNDIVVKPRGGDPTGFSPSSTEAYGTQELSSIPLEAGKEHGSQGQDHPARHGRRRRLSGADLRIVGECQRRSDAEPCRSPASRS